MKNRSQLYPIWGNTFRGITDLNKGARKKGPRKGHCEPVSENKREEIKKIKTSEGQKLP